MNNTTIAALFITLAVVSVGVNTWFYFVTIPDPTGQAAASARVCINTPPIPNVSGCGYAEELTYYSCQVRTFDQDVVGKTRTFIDNSTLFDITSDGWMNFFPEYRSRGNYSIQITVIDDSGCPNAIQSTTFTLIIRPYPSNDTISIWDTTDANITYKFDPVTFFANYSDIETNDSIPGAICTLDTTYVNRTNLLMTYNATSGLYERHEASGFVQGTYPYNVTCNGFGVGYAIQDANDSFTITNRPPFLFADFPNLTIEAGRSVSGFDLNDYFKDPDFDVLSFTETSTAVIDVQITALGIVTITPNPTIQGNYTIRFSANDGFASVESNIVIITVLPITFPPPQSGGGGGGGPTGPMDPPPLCTPEWECEEWGACLPTGIQQRTCIDLNACRSAEDQPDIIRDCEYIGTCSDNIKNCHSGLCEIGVDCGGPCAPCYFDGPPEEEITPPVVDRPSPIDQIPEPIRRASYIGFIIALLATVTTILLSLYLHENLFRIVGQWAARLIVPPERQVSELSQYVIGVEILYQRHKDGLSRKEFVSGVAERTSEMLAWALASTTALTFEEIRQRTSSLSKGQAKSISSFTALLETAQYRKNVTVSDHVILRGSRTLAEHLKATDPYRKVLHEAVTLKRSVKERLLSHLSEAMDVLIEHGRIHSARLLIDEADAYAQGLTKGEALERYRALRNQVIR